jgi:hypothetical protein
VSKRLLLLEKMTRTGSRDPFHWYALALEYAAEGRVVEALTTFNTLRSMESGYVPMYLMCGTMLVKAGRLDEAAEWLAQGVTIARGKGDQHAQAELEEALAGIRDVTKH